MINILPVNIEVIESLSVNAGACVCTIALHEENREK